MGNEMTMPVCSHFLLVVRFMDESAHKSEVRQMFDNFKKGNYCFDGKDTGTVASIYDEHKVQQESPITTLAVLSTGEDVSELFIAHMTFKQSEDGKWQIDTVVNSRCYSAGEPYFESLARLLSFSPNSPTKEGFATLIESELFAQAFALALPYSGNVLSAASLFCERGKTGENPEPFLSKVGQVGEDYEPLYAEEGRNDLFDLDYDRVVHLKSFRRLVDKAQVYGSSKGDHFRTRMTHTLVVAQIARSIAAQLNANVTLAETIALAHDLGHTPFGHQGERTLDKRLNALSSRIGFELGGFKHNFQSFRILARLEETHFGFVGCNVSWQVLEGCLWHTSVSRTGESCLRCVFNQLDPAYMDASEYYNKNVFHVDESGVNIKGCDHSHTIEGQIVAISDEIAQRSHDIDDAISAGLLSPEELVEWLGHFTYEVLGKQITSCLEMAAKYKEKGRLFVDELGVKRDRISSIIIHHLMGDVVEEAKSRICKASGGCLSADGHIAEDKVVRFSEKGERLNSYLERIVNMRVLSSSEIARFDDRGERIVGALFDKYYENPLLLPKNVLRRFIVSQRAADCSDVFDLLSVGGEIAKDEISRIKSEGVIEWDQPFFPGRPNEVSGGRSIEIMSVLHEDADKRREYSYLIKHVQLVRAIVDHIAGMTDTYAIGEYNSLVSG